MAKRGPKHRYQTVKQIQKDIDAYFDNLKIDDEISEPPTITGLALHLGFHGRAELIDQESREDAPEIANAVKRAKSRIEEAHERRLFGNNPTGSIFWLKNKGWSDKQELEHTGAGGGAIIITSTYEDDED